MSRTGPRIAGLSFETGGVLASGAACTQASAFARPRPWLGAVVRFGRRCGGPEPLNVVPRDAT